MPQSPPYPFVNQFPSLAPNEAIDPNKLATLALQVSTAADGRVWSDVSAVKNWKKSINAVPNPLNSSTLIRDPVSRRWLIFGEAGGEMCAIRTVSGLTWDGPIFVAGSPVLNQTISSAVNSAGVILAGGGASSNTTGKIRESTDGGANWITRNIGLSDQLMARALTYVPQLSLWICMVGGLSGGAGAGIYTSTDRITWTFQNSSVYSHFATKEFGSPIIIGTTHNFAGATNTYTRSVDGINWSPQTGPWPENSTCRGCWSEENNAFFVGSFTGIWKSTSALTGEWTKVSNDSMSGGSSIGAFGRVLIRGDGKASLDGGVTWFQVLELASNDHFVTAYTDFGVGIARSTSREIYLSHHTGF
jgi:hypothetical protein